MNAGTMNAGTANADSREDAGGEPRRGRAVLLVAARAHDFVHRAELEAAPRHGSVERRHAKRQHAERGGCRALNSPDARTQHG
jgi:hypothetical protein